MAKYEYFVSFAVNDCASGIREPARIDNAVIGLDVEITSVVQIKRIEDNPGLNSQLGPEEQIKIISFQLLKQE